MGRDGGGTGVQGCDFLRELRRLFSDSKDRHFFESGIGCHLAISTYDPIFVACQFFNYPIYAPQSVSLVERTRSIGGLKIMASR